MSKIAPFVLPVERQGLPPALAGLSLWITWRLAWHDGRQQWGKIPLKPVDDGYSPFASPDNQRHRWPLETCLTVVSRRGADGVGIVTNDTVVAIDLDHCFHTNGALKRWAEPLVERFDSYCEYSPSAKGLHIVAHCQSELANRDWNLPDGKVQFFSHNHFCTMTGHRYRHQHDVEDCTSELVKWHSEMWDNKAPLVANTAACSYTGRVNEDELLLKMFAARRGDNICRLWMGDTAGYPSHSEADLALMNHLAFWCNKDAKLMAQLFRRSRLYRPNEKDDDYLVRTIATAIASVATGYRCSDVSSTEVRK